MKSQGLLLQRASVSIAASGDSERNPASSLGRRCRWALSAVSANSWNPAPVLFRQNGEDHKATSQPCELELPNPVDRCLIECSNFFRVFASAETDSASLAFHDREDRNSEKMTLSEFLLFPSHEPSHASPVGRLVCDSQFRKRHST